METLELYLSPLDAKRFKVIDTTQGEVLTSLPFFDGEIDWRTTLIKVLEASSFSTNGFQNDEQDWMVKSGILLPNKQAFHQDYLKNIGKSLYQSLFPQKIENLLFAAIQKAGDKLLTIRLTFPANVAETRLADYPWELLHDDQRFLLHRNIRIYRYIAHPSPLPSFTWEKQVNVLLISPTVSYQTDESKKAEERDAQSKIRNVLKKVQDNKYIKFEELKPATHKKLVDYLNQHQGESAPHVLHFNGHGLFGRVCVNPKCRKTYTGSEVSRDQCRKCGQQLPNPQGYLVFQDEEEKPDYISAEQFGATLEQVGDGSNELGKIALVVLTACQSAMAVTGDSVFNGTAQNLIGHRIPAVVAMQYSVEIPSATKFAEDFYRSLVSKNSLIVAINEARVAMGVGGNQWYRPVLYMRVNTIELELPPQQKIENAEAYTAEKELLDRYLHWLIEQNFELELPGLPGGKYHPVELETVYVALRGDLSNPYEREQSQARLEQQAREETLFADKELTKEQGYQIFKHIIRSLALAPIPVSIEERDRPHLFHKPNKRTITLGEAVQQERRLVILGDPGSGKTTLCRWLVLKLAQAYLLKKPEVLIPIHHVNPAADETDELVSLGATRIPILVRVASFANARNAKPELRLAQFLGHHLGSDYENTVADSRGRKIDSHTLNKVFLNLFETGRVILLLDGLDEIANPTIRIEIVREIDFFIKELIPDNVASPCEVGGNQVIITSRIVGYQMASLRNQSAHLTIEPMSERAINRFCDVWMKAIHKASIPGERWDTQAETAAIQEATELKGAIADLQQRGAGDLASNPLLITILTLIFRNGQKQQGKASFPRQRVKLYETAVNILIDKWRERAIRKGEREFAQEEVIKILVPLAAHIHETSNIGVVNDIDLEQILKQHLSNLDAAQFQQVVREEVGILAARGQGVYGFLHLTFQEYLAGHWLIEERERISERLLEKLSSPRWREPILMALGQLSVELNETTLETLLLEMLNKPDTLGHLLPRTVLLLVAALPEMVKVPDCVIEELTFQLLRAYAQRTTLERFPLLREQLEQAFSQLVKQKYVNIVERVLRKVLAYKISEHSEQIFASVTLMHIARYYPIRLAKALADIWIHDSKEWNWPIDNALRDIAVNFPDVLPDKPGSLRSKLLARPKLAEKFLANPMWVRLGMAIYGGLDTSISERINKAKDKISQLNYEQQQILNVAQFSQSKETIERLNKELAEWNATLENLKKNGHQFSIKRIHRDSSLTPLLLEALQNERSPDSLILTLWEKWKNENSLIVKIDTCLALAALGEPIAPILQEDIFLTQQIIPRILRLIRFLENAVQSASSATIESLKELGGCTWGDWTDLVVATLNVRLAFQQEPANPLRLEELANELYKPLILAETLQYFFSGASDDPVYNLTVVIDTDGNQLSNPPIKLAQALANTYLSTNSQWNKHIGWSLEKIPPRAVEQLDVLTAALDALVTIPGQFDFFRGWILVQLAPLLHENGLIIEAIIIAVGSLSDKFQALSETIEVLTKFQENLSDLLTDTYPENSLLQALQTIDDPYLRFRGYLRLMDYFPFLQISFVVKSSDFSEFHYLIVNVQEAAYAIKDVSRKEWAFEQLARICHPTQKLQWLQQAVQIAEKVSDFENRARAYARLASDFSLEQGLKLFLSALENVKEIPDIRKKTETLVLFRESLNRYPQAYSRFQEVVSSLDTWNQAKALGFNAPLFQKYVTELGEINNETTSLVLGAIFNDIQLQFSLPPDLGRLWSALLSTQKLFALEALCQRAKKETLLLTQEATAALNQLIKQGDVETVSRLIPLVQSPDSRSIPILEDWLVHLYPLIKQYIYLLIAEAGKISEQTIPTLIELLTCSEDRTRYRAALVLHGNRLDSIHLKTSTLGVNTLLELAQKGIELLEENSPQFSLVIAWAFERTYHNNGQILETLVQIAKSHTVDSEKALFVLRKINLISANVWLIFLQELRDGTSEIQGALLQSFCRLLVKNCITEGMWQKALLILRNINSEALEDYEFILDQPAKLVESASLAWEMLKDNSRVVSNLILEAEEIFIKNKQNLLEILQNKDSNIIKSLFISVGELIFCNQAFTARINSAAEFVEKKPQLLEILIDWLEIKLQEKSFEQDFERFIVGDLLSVVAACAERLPNTFYNKVSSSSTLQTRLLEVVEYHNTFPGRQAALVLLSYFYSITEETIDALKVALRDVVEVQDVAIQTVDRYHEIDSDLLPQLFENLLDPSPAVGFATAQMLAVIARNVYLKPYLREEIIRAFVKAIDNDFSKRDVYLFVKEEVSSQNYVYRIKYKGQLDEIFYKIVTQLSGITDISKRKELVSEDNTI